MKTKAVIVFMMLVSTLMFGLASMPVMATEGDVFNTFEGATVNANNWTMNGITFDGDQTNSACAVDDDPVYAGSRSWKHEIMNNLDPYYINLSVPTKSISFWWRITDYQYCDIDMYFFNTDDELIIWLEWEDSYFSLYNHDHENYDTEIHHVGMATDDCWNFLRITMNATDEVSFISNFDSLTSWSNITDTPRYIHDNWNISYIRVEGDEDHIGVTQYMWIDNFAYNYLLGGDGGSSGQEEGDPTDGSDYKRCSYGDIGNINIYAPYHDSFITTFGDVTINAVDLFVSDNQYALVNSSKSAYVAYVNGVSIGAPDYFFQDSSDEYILRWEFNSINVGTYDIVLEFGMTGDSGAPFHVDWMGLPTNKYNIQGSKYDDDASDFGDGLQQGIYFYPAYTDYRIKYCIYYDSNIPVTDATTIQTNCLEDEIHYINHTYTFSANSVGGSSVWSLLNGTFVEMYSGSFHSGFDSQIIPMPYGYGDGTWYFNVSSSNTYSNCSFSVIPTPTGDYFIYPSGGHDRLVGDGWLDILWKAPDGDDVYMMGLHYNEEYEEWFSIFNWSVTGTGNVKTQVGLASFQNEEWTGTWLLGLYNETTNVRVADDYLVLHAVMNTYWFNVLEYADDWQYGWLVPGDRALIVGANGFSCIGSPCGHYIVIEKDGIIVFSFDVTEQESFASNLIYQFPDAGTYLFYFSVDYDDKTPYDNVVRTVVIRADSDGDGMPDELDTDDDEDEEFTPTPILPDLGATWGMIMGLMIVSFFTLLPLLLTHMTNQKGFNFTIPAIVYVLFAGIGALISFAFELFQDWVLFFIIAIGIIALGILYLIGQRQNVGG